MLGGNPMIDYHPIQGGIEILLVPLCYRTDQDKLRPDVPLAHMHTLHNTADSEAESDN